jgi:hypothetical protein
MLEKFTPEEAERIIAESRATLSRPPFHSSAHESERQEDHRIDDGDDRAHVHDLSPLESRVAREIREITEQEEQFRQERERERRKQERREAAKCVGSFWAATDQRIDALEAQVCDGFRATGQITEAINGELDALRVENVELKASLARLEARLAELELRAAEMQSTERKLIELPSRAVQ